MTASTDDYLVSGMEGRLVIDRAVGEAFAHLLDVWVTSAGSGGRLAHPYKQIRDDLRVALTGVPSGVDARTPVQQWITDNPVIHCEDELLDSADAARVLGITGNGVRDLRRRGRLSATKAGGRWLFRRRDLDEFAASRTR